MKGHLREAKERTRMMDDGHDGACNAFADYFEHEGRKWEDGLVAEGELGSYFVLKVSAAGWHSAALVLVDEQKAEMARQRHLVVPPAKSSSRPNNDAAPPYPYGLASLCMFLVHLVRWFLGLTARDAIAAENAKQGRWRREGVHAKGRDDGNSHGGADDDDDDVLDENQAQRVPMWAEDPFPRLRMADGEAMPGEIAITESWTS